LELQKKQVEQEFSDGKIAENQIETKAQKLQKVIQKITEKEERWFELSARVME